MKINIISIWLCIQKVSAVSSIFAVGSRIYYFTSSNSIPLSCSYSSLCVSHKTKGRPVRVLTYSRAALPQASQRYFFINYLLFFLQAYLLDTLLLVYLRKQDQSPQVLHLCISLLHNSDFLLHLRIVTPVSRW